MTTKTMKRKFKSNLTSRPLVYFVGAVILVLFLRVEMVQAQYSGHNLLGDFGLMAGSQPPQGRYADAFSPYYRTDTIKY